MGPDDRSRDTRTARAPASSAPTGGPGAPASSAPLLELRDLQTYYPVKGGGLSPVRGHLKAVDGVNLSIRPGETLGLVGESGCGKSTLGRTIVGLEKATGGQVLFRGEDTSKASRGKLRQIRRDIQMVFQDPQASLNPRMKIVDIITEGLRVGGASARAKERRDKAVELLSVVGLRAEHLERYPHEFSGGQRQRIGIARALAVNPAMIIADEAVSALDVSVQAQVLNLLSDLQRDFQLTYLFIAHDLAVVEYISDRIGVMYLGRIVELASATELAAHPRMPYTQALLSAIPRIEADEKRERIVLSGEPPNPMDPPSGCPFRLRCWKAQSVCAEQRPELREVRPQHWAACHFPDEA
jgi:oligopeptide/dipeptide ABC transporter ATP-binding protein